MPNQNLHIVHALMSAIFNYFLFLRIKILRELKLKNKPLKEYSSQNRSFPWSHEPRDENQKNQANAFISLISDLSWKLNFETDLSFVDQEIDALENFLLGLCDHGR